MRFVEGEDRVDKYTGIACVTCTGLVAMNYCMMEMGREIGRWRLEVSETQNTQGRKGWACARAQRGT